MQALRGHRRWLSLWLAGMLLLALLATAAYACPRATDAAALPDCHDSAPVAMDPDLPLLCKAHCEAGQQSVNSLSGAAGVPAPALVAALWVRALDVAEAAQTAAALPEAQSVGPPAGAPPLYLALLVLRN